MGNLSKTYTPDMSFNAPSWPNPTPDSYKTDGGNPHWREETDPLLKNEDLSVMNISAISLARDSTDSFDMVYQSLGSINALEPIITFGGSSALVDERFDKIILQLTDLNEKIIEYIESTQGQVMTIADNYIADHTESCITKTEIKGTRTITLETGETSEEEYTWGYTHTCNVDAHSRDYEVGVACEFCGE